MGQNFGAAATQMCQAERHWKEGVSLHLTNQFIGWVLAHDVLPGQLDTASHLISEMKLWRDSVKFLPYWKQQVVTTSTSDVVISAHTQPNETSLWIVNTSWEDREAAITVDLQSLGLSGKSLQAFDAETAEPVKLTKAGEMSVVLPPRMWRAIRIVKLTDLEDGQTFVATFDQATLTADAAIGNPSALTPVAGHWDDVTYVDNDSGGKAIAIDRRTHIRFSTRHHAFAQAGEITMRFQRSKDDAFGTIFILDDLRLELGGDGKLSIQRVEGRQATTLADNDEVQLDTGKWYSLRLSWSSDGTTVSLDGKPLLQTDQAPSLDTDRRGLHIHHNRFNRAGPPTFGFGPARSVLIDGLEIRSAWSKQ